VSGAVDEDDAADEHDFAYGPRAALYVAELIGQATHGDAFMPCYTQHWHGNHLQHVPPAPVGGLPVRLYHQRRYRVLSPALRADRRVKKTLRSAGCARLRHTKAGAATSVCVRHGAHTA
jgi:hypothetical protein